MKLIRKILFPIVPIYFLVTLFRNWLYDKGIRKSQRYNFPIICVGNLSVGGTGKTPMIEYLIRLFKDNYKVATLSRGYGRKTKGFILADQSSNASNIGDEPFQFYNKFENILVAVDANRRQGIEKIKSDYKADLILLDDAFQHRKVTAGLNILLTPYGNLYSKDIVLPTGNLREPKSGAKRADLIVITKCPQDITQNDKDEIIKQLKPKVKQNLFFSWIYYDEFIYSTGEKVKLKSLKGKDFTIVTGIANPKPFVSHLKSNLGSFKHLKYKDHHHFSEADLRALKQEKIIITTEKDYSRLRFDFDENQSGTKLYYLPIRFEVDNKIEFNRILIEFTKSY